MCAALKVTKGKQVLCSKTLEAKEGEEARVWELCQDVTAWSLECMAAREAGIIAFESSQARAWAGLWALARTHPPARFAAPPASCRVPPQPRLAPPPPAPAHAHVHTPHTLQDDYEPRTFHFLELYESNAHLGRHNNEARYTEFMEGVAPLLERPVGMVLYEYHNGQIGVPSVQVRGRAREVCV